MKKRIIGWLIVSAAVLLIGLASFRSESGTQNAAMQRINEAKRSTAIAATNPIPPPANSVSGTTTNCELLEEREIPLANGNVEVRRLVKRADKYPYRIVVETLRKDLDLKKFVPAGRLEMVADHVLVNLREGVTRDALEQLAVRYNAQIVRSLSDERTFVVRLEAPGLDAIDQAVAYFSEAAESIAYAEPDYVRHLSVVPNDTLYGNLWGMPAISAPDAWDITTGSSDSVVAVIDTGMDMDHPDLLANLWINTIEIAGDGVDNDGNGYVDDVNGWDFVTEDKDPEDGDGHGTHCAGTIGAVGNNANQVVGVCWQASIMPLRVGTSQGLMDSDIVDGIRYAARNGAKVLSNSYGGPGFSQTTYDAIVYANDQGCIFVAAAGNDSSDNDFFPMYPAGYDLPNVISVAATDSSDNLATFSNYGASSVDLAAPGVGIVSTYLAGGTESLDGTSMACPHVAGAMALLVSENPQVSPIEAKQLAMESVDEIAVLDGKVVSGGRLNVFAMFANANDTDQDGMPDTWEVRHGLNPNDASDADGDNDGDFLTNLQEYKNACDPNDEDSDNDSLIDGWEVQYGFNPLNVWGTLPKLQYLGFNSDCQDAYDVVVRNGYAYVADGLFGLKVLDLTLPESPELVGSYATSGSAEGVAVEGNYAYVADAEEGLFIIDISNPADPVFAASLPHPARKVTVGGGKAFLAAGTNGIHAINVAVPASPVLSGTFDGNNDPNFEVNDVELVGATVYMALNGGFAQITTSLTGYSVKAIADGEGNRNCSSITHDGSTLYVSLNDFGAFAYTLSKTLLGSAATPGSAEDVAYSEGLLYVADGIKGLRILDATTPAAIESHANYDNIHAYGVTVANGYAYVAGKAFGLQVFRSSVDSDEDGMYDGWEIENFGSLTQSYTDDYDADGIINWGEYLANLDPTSPDQDSDGLIDGTQEVRIYLTDPRTADTDDDGLTDSEEINTHGTDPINADTDGDGMPDGWEVAKGLNPLVDDAALDSDIPSPDGATNLEEYQAGTDPFNPDTDADGLPDGWEIEYGIDPLDSTLDNGASGDPDGDTLSNLDEYGYGTNPLKADSDDDGLSDFEEINTYGTDPTNADTDGDGMADGWEVDYGLDPFVNDRDGQLDDDNKDGLIDTNDLANVEEYLLGTDPTNGDTDGDEFYDGIERDLGTMATNAVDPIFVDDDHISDPQAYDPMISSTNENGSWWFPFDSIQEGIDNAVDGMTVLVTNGYYIGHGNMDIDPMGKSITIRSWNGAVDTIIDADGLGSGFVCQSGETTNTVVKGFSITSPPGDCSDGDCGYEHGIVCKDGSSPSLEDCIIFDCALSGIRCSFASNPKIENTIIDGCGNGIYCTGGATPAITDSVVENCGSGISAVDSFGLNVSGSLIINCFGRGIAVYNDSTCEITGSAVLYNLGGMLFDNSMPFIDACVIEGNVAPDYYTLGGSATFNSITNIALSAENNPDKVDVTDADENGAGIRLSNGSVLMLQNSVLAQNNAVALDPDYPASKTVPEFGLGGGLYIGVNCHATNMNCTYGDNEARRGGGISSHGSETDYIRNTVLWGNDAIDQYIVTVTNFTTNLVFVGMDGTNELYDVEVESEVVPAITNVFVSSFDSLHCRSGAFNVWYCDVEHGGTYVKPYKYVIEVDPVFTNGYELAGSSPCIDAGTITYAPINDINGTGRPLDGDNNGQVKVDIGAYEYVHPLADSDGDGTLDVDEIANGTDPTTMASALTEFLTLYGLSSTGADNDLDGLSNLAEYLAGTNPTNTDTDGDHSPDGDEMIAGTIATDPTSYFYVSDIRSLAAGGCEVVFDTAPGRFYTVYYCTAIGGAWDVLVVDEPGDGSTMVIVDPNSEDSCFYKVEVIN